MRNVTLLLALLLCSAPVLAQSTPDHVTLCGHTLRVEGRALTGLRAGPVTLAEGTITLEAATLANGAAVIVRVARDGTPVEAAVAVCINGAAPALAWRGSTAWRGEDVGDRVRDVVTARGVAAGRSEILVLRERESPRLCGASATVAEVSRVDPSRATLAPAPSIDPLSMDATSVATGSRVEAVPVTAAAFTPRVVAASAGNGRALFDHDPATVWAPGAHGFATVTLPSAAFMLRGVDLVPARVGGARRWTLQISPGLAGTASDAQPTPPSASRFDFELPATVLPPGRAWRVTLPSPLPARCVSLVARGAPPGAGVAELTLRSALDDGPAALSALALALDGPDGSAAASLLAEVGPAGVRALASAVPQLGPTGARRVLRLLGAARTPESLAALVTALARDDTAQEAAESLRLAGPTALDALTSVAATNPRAARVIASVNASVTAKLRALIPALSSERDVWSEVRPELTQLLAQAAREHAGEGWLEMLPDGALAASRALRATAEAIPGDDPLRAAIAARARTLWRAAPDFETRYRLLAPLAGDAEGQRIAAEVLAHDADHDLRAEAARALRGASAATDSLRSALNDRTPRVRIAAAEGLRGRIDATDALVRSLSNDPWPTVRAAAAASLADVAGAAPALLAALDARSVVTVRAVIAALSQNPGEGISARLVAFLDEGRRSPTLRREAAEALGRRCDASAAGGLERVAGALSDPALPPWEQEVGHAALASLARLDAARARAFLTRSEANSEAASAVERAARRGCSPR